MIFHQSGPATITFTVQLSPLHLQRVGDFLNGMGVEAKYGVFDFQRTLQMTHEQKQRWDNWTKENNIKIA
jgi:DNA-binding transcriptional regulator WhiA